MVMIEYNDDPDRVQFFYMLPTRCKTFFMRIMTLWQCQQYWSTI